MPLVLIANQYGGKVLRSPLRARFDTNGGTLGRSSTNHLVLPDSNHHVSRVHATIRCESGFFLLEVQGQNPVQINNKSLRTGQSRRLTSGDEIAIGPYRISVAIEHEGEPLETRPLVGTPAPVIATTGSQPVTQERMHATDDTGATPPPQAGGDDAHRGRGRQDRQTGSQQAARVSVDEPHVPAAQATPSAPASPQRPLASDRQEPTYFIPDATLFSRGPKEPAGRIATDITLQTRFSIPIKTEEKTSDPAPEPQLRTSVQDAAVNETMVRRISWAEDVTAPDTRADASRTDPPGPVPEPSAVAAGTPVEAPPTPLLHGDAPPASANTTWTIYTKPGQPAANPAAAQAEHAPAPADSADATDDATVHMKPSAPMAALPEAGVPRTDPVFIIPDSTLFSRGPKEPKARIATDIVLQTSLRLPIAQDQTSGAPQKEPKLFTPVQDAQVAETVMRRIDWADARLDQPDAEHPSGEPTATPAGPTPSALTLSNDGAHAVNQHDHLPGPTAIIEVPAASATDQTATQAAAREIAAPATVAAPAGLDVEGTFAEALVRGLGLDPLATGSQWSSAQGLALGKQLRSLLLRQQVITDRDSATEMLEKIAQPGNDVAPPPADPD